jgi:hypothetical protein
VSLGQIFFNYFRFPCQFSFHRLLNIHNHHHPGLVQFVGFPPRWPLFDARSGYVGYVTGKVALGQVFFNYFRFPWQFSFRRLLSIHHHPGWQLGKSLKDSYMYNVIINLME